MSFFPTATMIAHCLTCGGTGKRGNLSGKKKCRKCDGSGIRHIEIDDSNRTVLDTFVPDAFDKKKQIT